LVLKAWFAVLLPERGRSKDKCQSETRQVLTMEFKLFVNAFARVLCQIVRAGRRIVYRLLAWNPWQRAFRWRRRVDRHALPTSGVPAREAARTADRFRARFTLLIGVGHARSPDN
jgi:hypothetical protein